MHACISWVMPSFCRPPSARRPAPAARRPGASDTSLGGAGDQGPSERDGRRDDPLRREVDPEEAARREATLAQWEEGKRLNSKIEALKWVAWRREAYLSGMAATWQPLSPACMHRLQPAAEVCVSV